MLNADEILKAPFPWFGGKSTVAPEVWEQFGDVPNYVEPFLGSGAVLLGRPHVPHVETVNDKDGYVANFWRAVKSDPEAVAHHADNPVNENDLHARHSWLVERKAGFAAKLDGDPDFHDAKVAGWWCWGICCWIGSGWCSGSGPWRSVEMEDGNRQLVHLGDAGQGVNRKRVHLGNAENEDKRPLVTNDPVGVANQDGILNWMLALAERYKRVRVCCGDWSRVCGPTPTVKQGLTGVFLDPPYPTEANRAELYREEDFKVAHTVAEWAIANGDDKRMRIAFCGYEGSHVFPESWKCFSWKARGGFGSQAVSGDNVNATRERIWFSPHCRGISGPVQANLFS